MVEPAVVIAEDRDDSSRRAKSRQLDGDLFGRNEASTEHTLNDKVAQNADEVGLRGVRAIDHQAEFGHPIEGRANVQIGEDRDTQGSFAGPLEAQLVFRYRETRRFDPERPETQGGDETPNEPGRPYPRSSTQW